MSLGGITRVALSLAVAGRIVSAQPQEALPRFRADAALVQVDAYISKEGVSITDLRLEEVEVLEDDRPQEVSNVSLVQPRRIPVATAISQPADGALVVLFFDTGHVSPENAERGHEQLSKWLSAIIAPQDRVGIMTPEISAQNITLTRAAGGIDAMLRDLSQLGDDVTAGTDARERELQECYPEAGVAENNRAVMMTGVAKELVERRREQKTLRALDDLVTYLERQRNERKFVIVVSQGWTLFRRSERLAAVPGGGARRGDAGFDGCERERVMLASVDNVIEARKLAQRANRANVSVYPIDPAGLGMGPTLTTSAAEQERSAARQSGLRELAAQTDGTAVLSVDEVSDGVERLRADLRPYYVLSYYSSNRSLDGRFRRVSVRVKREGVEVRTRFGYLSMSETEARTLGIALPSQPGSRPPLAVARPTCRSTPTSRPLAAQVQATGDVGSIHAIVEVDGAVLSQADWLTGGSVRMSIESEGGGPVDTIEAVMEPGQRVATLASKIPLAPGRYTVRAEMKSNMGASALQGSTIATVVVATAVAGTAALASRRGAGTASAYEPTADPRFRRTERLQIEVPVLSRDVSTGGRLLTRNGRPMPLPVTVRERVDAMGRWAVADVGLAPLAAGEYVFELSMTAGEKAEVVAYAFRVIP